MGRQRDGDSNNLLYKKACRFLVIDCMNLIQLEMRRTNVLFSSPNNKRGRDIQRSCTSFGLVVRKFMLIEGAKIHSNATEIGNILVLMK